MNVVVWQAEEWPQKTPAPGPRTCEGYFHGKTVFADATKGKILRMGRSLWAIQAALMYLQEPLCLASMAQLSVSL